MSFTVVTGASGFVGGVLVPMLLVEGRRVRATEWTYATSSVVDTYAWSRQQGSLKG